MTCPSLYGGEAKGDKVKFFKTLLEAFERHVAERPAKDAFVFLGNGIDETDRLTYATLRARALGVADKLRRNTVEGGPVLLVYPPGLEFIVALLGCFYARAIAVPVPFLVPRRARDRLGAIASACRPRAVLSITKIVDIRPDEPALTDAVWIATDADDDNEVLPGATISLPAAADIALIQYSSGSTAAPKGVVISHGNLAHNQRMMAEVFGHHTESVAVNWLPTYHDMGLIGPVLQSLYCGMTGILMPPLKALQRPMFWLQAISRYKGNTNGAPTLLMSFVCEPFHLSSAERWICARGKPRSAAASRSVQRCSKSSRQASPSPALRKMPFCPVTDWQRRRS